MAHHTGKMHRGHHHMKTHHGKDKRHSGSHGHKVHSSGGDKHHSQHMEGLAHGYDAPEEYESPGDGENEVCD